MVGLNKSYSANTQPIRKRRDTLPVYCTLIGESSAAYIYEFLY